MFKNFERILDFYGIKFSFHRHLARNPFICDCNLRWLNAYLHAHPIETSGAKCESPKRAQKRKIDSMRDDKFKCKGKHDPIFFHISLLKRNAGTHNPDIQVGNAVGYFPSFGWTEGSSLTIRVKKWVSDIWKYFSIRSFFPSISNFFLSPWNYE